MPRLLLKEEDRKVKKSIRIKKSLLERIKNFSVVLNISEVSIFENAIENYLDELKKTL